MLEASEVYGMLSSGDLAGAEQAVAEGFDLAAARRRGHTLLQWAVCRKEHAIQAWLLGHHAQPDTTTQAQAKTPLALAIGLGDDVSAKMLLAAGADPNAMDAMGTPPLVHAVQCPVASLEMVDLLLAAGADPNAANGAGDNALMVAVQEGRDKIIVRLAATAIDPNHTNVHGETAAFPAATARPRVAQVLFDTFPVLDLDHQSMTGTLPITRAHDPQVIAQFIAHGANPNARSTNPAQEGRTVLMNIIASASPGEEGKPDQTKDLVAMALAHGADPGVADDKGSTSMAYAVIASCHRASLHGQILDMYESGAFKAGAPLDTQGTSPYHAAVTLADAAAAEFVSALHSLGVPMQPSPVRKAGETPHPLGFAICLGNLPAARALVDAGAGWGERGPDGSTPSHALAILAASVARRQARLDRRRVLSVAMGKPIASRQGADDSVDTAAAEWMTWLSGQPVDFAAIDAEGCTPLAAMVPCASREWIAWAMAHGADPDAAGPDTPHANAWATAIATCSIASLHTMLEARLAATPGWVPPMAEWVLDLADAEIDNRSLALEAFGSLLLHPSARSWIDHPDQDGNTPLLTAAATGQTDVMRVLLAYGADASQSNALGETALHHAAARQDSIGVSMLVTSGASVEATTGAGVAVSDILSGSAEMSEAARTRRVVEWRPSRETVAAMQSVASAKSARRRQSP